MKLALMQTDIIWENKEKNLSKAEKLVASALQHDCDVLVFPEMFSTGFSMDAETVAEYENGPVLTFLKNAARRYQVNIIAGIAIDNDGIYENRAYAVNEEGEVICTYTKNYSFSYSGEDKVYQSGSDQSVFEIDDVKASVFICYDLRFPELFRQIAQKVSMVFVIANWPESRISHWDSLLKARAIENQCFVVGVNRKGVDGNGLKYNGHSSVFSPTGEEIEILRLDGECRCFEINEGETAFVRQRFPFLRDIKK